MAGARQQANQSQGRALHALLCYAPLCDSCVTSLTSSCPATSPSSRSSDGLAPRRQPLMRHQLPSRELSVPGGQLCLGQL